MKKLLACILFTILWIPAFPQDNMEQVMEKRAREMYRIICLTDKTQWRTFIRENYTQALIDKPMRATVQEGDQGVVSSSQVQSADNLEAKVMMFERLHDDFGGSKIISIKSNGDVLKMTLNNGEGLTGIIQMKFAKSKPYLIEGLGIQAEN